jgi:cysteine desulfurase
MQATTPLDPRALDAMLPFFGNHFGNPHSSSHVFGWDAEVATETARGQVAALVGASPKEVFFTSGATESNNQAVKGVAAFYKGKKKHIITTQIEHKCILASCRQLETEHGWDVTYLPVGQDGLINLKQLEEAIRPDTAMVSVMMVNNEIGVVQPMKEIGEMCRANRIFFHTDAAQAAGKIPLDVDDLKIDLMSLSGHKVYGPKGIGALYVRRKPRVRVRPIIEGGGQERGLRSGTLPTPIIVGFGKACEIAKQEMANDEAHVERLFNRMMSQIQAELPEVTLNGHPQARYKGNLNLSFAGVEGESLLMSMAQKTAISSGSACTSASLEPSYVLRAIGVDEELAHTSLRFGIGRFTTEEECDKSVADLVVHVRRLRDLSPLWELHLEALDNPDFKGKVQWS